jgi:hypothetical protein
VYEVTKSELNEDSNTLVGKRLHRCYRAPNVIDTVITVSTRWMTGSRSSKSLEHGGQLLASKHDQARYFRVVNTK